MPLPSRVPFRLRFRLGARVAEQLDEPPGEKVVQRPEAAGRLAVPGGDDAAKERRLDRPDDEPVARRVVEEVAEVFVLLRGQLLNRLTSARPDEQEDLPHVDVEAVEERDELRELLDVLLHDRGVHLDDEAVAAQQADRGERLLEVAVDAADPLVVLGVAPSRLIDTTFTPAARIRSVAETVERPVTLGESATGMPSERAKAASSRESVRISTSPPVRTSTG